MDISGFHVPSILSASGTFASVYGAFSRFDGIQSEANRSFVSSWLKGFKAPQAEWSAFFLEIFRNFFGEKHLSLKCFWRSALLSVFIAAAITAPKLLPVSSGDFTGDVVETLLSWLVASCITDYLSLWKTRALLTRFDAVRKRTTVAGLIAIDFVGTTIIYLLSWELASHLLYLVMLGRWIPELIVTKSFLPRFMEVFFGGHFWESDLLFYRVALLTSAWLWMYVIVSQILRILTYVPSFVAGLSKVADLDEHPVRTIGVIVAVVSAAAVGIGSAL